MASKRNHLTGIFLSVSTMEGEIFVRVLTCSAKHSRDLETPLLLAIHFGLSFPFPFCMILTFDVTKFTEDEHWQ